MRKFLFTILAVSSLLACSRESDNKPRVLISTDIGGTDPDDNQSMTHLLQFSDMLDIEGLVSSPSYGGGSKSEILRMIDLYQKDGGKNTNRLRRITKQGRTGQAPLCGWGEPTEGSDWIVKCARKKDSRPLYVLVWGGLEDLAQALHDAPDIRSRIRVYWIGGPNKKWSADCYAYIAENFPDLWIIENNSSYRGFIFWGRRVSPFKEFWADYLRGRGALGDDFVHYYNGTIKMGDTPSVLYVLNYKRMDPSDPTIEHWGGKFCRIDHSARRIFDRPLSVNDTIPVFGVIEMHIQGPVKDIAPDEPCLTMTCVEQEWKGYYLGNGEYMVRYAPKAAGTLSYEIQGEGIEQSGEFTVTNLWPGPIHEDDWKLGPNWFSDLPDWNEFENGNQGANTVARWRDTALGFWAQRTAGAKFGL